MNKIQMLQASVKAGEWDKVTSLWLDLLDEGLAEIAPLAPVTHELWRRGQRALAMELLGLTIEICETMDNPAVWLDALRLLASYQPRAHELKKDTAAIFEDLKDKLATAFKRLYHDRPYLLCWIAQLQQRPLEITDFIQAIDKLAVFEQGLIVRHNAGCDIGKVVELHGPEMEIVIKFRHNRHATMQALTAADVLVPLQPDDFEALVAFAPERLQVQAHEEPMLFMRRVLAYTRQPTSARELKQLLTPHIISTSEWSKWWPRIRKQMIRDPYIATDSSARGKYYLRDKPLLWEDQMYTRLQEAAMIDYPTLVLEYLEISTQKPHLQSCIRLLLESCQHHLDQAQPWYAWEAWCVLQQALQQGAQAPSDLVTPDFSPHALSIFCHLRLPVLASKTWELLQNCDPQWGDKITSIFLKGTDLSRETLCHALKRQQQLGEYLPAIFQQLRQQALDAPAALAWYAKKIISGRLGPLEQSDLPFLYQLLVQTGATLKALGQKKAVNQFKKVFSLTLAEKLGNALTSQEAQEAYRSLSQQTWLPDNFQKALREILRERFPKMLGHAPEPIYTTQAGLDKYTREYEDLLQNKIPANAQAIGHALDFGDLSENAELDAAREQQVRLTTKAAQMRKDLDRAEVIQYDQISTDQVAIGTRVTLKNSKHEINYTILGPWDTQLDQGIISYLSQVARELMNAKVGDTVTLPKKGEYQVIKIERFQPFPAEE